MGVLIVKREPMKWHRQCWVKVGRPFPDPDRGSSETLQRWECAMCGEPRELYEWATPRTYWHGHRKWV